MTLLIKSTHVIEQPVVLTRARKWTAPEAAFGSTSSEPTFETPASTTPETHPTSVEPAPPAAAAEMLSYDEYKQRFEEELSVLAEQARQEGMERGLAEGRGRGMAECTAHLDALANLVASARAALDRTIDGVADIGVEVVCEAVAKIVGQAVIERDGAIAIVREVIRRAKERSRLVMRVSPADYEMLEGCRDQLLEGLSAGSVDIVADDRVQLGGCLLETPVGSFDGRLETQLKRLRETLVGATPMPRETEAA